eukprot:24402-Hanusia_phi.AAC.1
MVNGRCPHCSMTASGIPKKAEVISRVDILTQEIEQFKIEIVRLMEPLSRSAREQHGGGCIADGVYLEDLRRKVANVQDKVETLDDRVGRLDEVVMDMSRKLDRVLENTTLLINMLKQNGTKLIERRENTTMTASTASGQREDVMMETSLVTRDRELAADREVDQVRMEEE